MMKLHRIGKLRFHASVNICSFRTFQDEAGDSGTPMHGARNCRGAYMEWILASCDTFDVRLLGDSGAFGLLIILYVCMLTHKSNLAE